MDQDKLREIFEEAKREGKDVAIELTVPTREETEVIIVKNANLDYKLDYYKNNYDYTCTLNRCRDIYIVDAKVIKFTM